MREGDGDRKMQDYETIICPKCRSIVTTYYGYCPKCRTPFPKKKRPKGPKKPTKPTPTPPPMPVDPVKLKAEEIAKYLENNYVDIGSRDCSKAEVWAQLKNLPRLKLNDEQAYSLAVENQFCLVEARAGSGKTRTIVGKLLDLLDARHYSPEQVMALSFNRVVREEIGRRVNNDFRYKGCGYSKRDFDVAKTFHSLAYHSEENHKIMDGSVKEALIRDLLNCLKLNPLFKLKVYTHFKKESFQLDRAHFKDEKSFYAYLRNLTFSTLRGETVKSLGEKWIADFLYEHGVNYQYEKRFFPYYIKENSLSAEAEKKKEILSFLDCNCRRSSRGSIVRESVIPDFYLDDYRLILEHWGIDEKEQRVSEKANFAERFDMSWDEYKEKMLWKREFWNSDLRESIIVNNRFLEAIKSVTGLIETSVVDLQDGREAFENHLVELLQECGVQLHDCDQEELEEEVWNRQFPRFARMMQTFVDKFEQHYPEGNVKQVREEMASLDLDDRQRDFIEIGLTVTEKYYEITRDHRFPLFLKNKEKYQEYDCDYNQLMANATRSILEGKSDSVVCNIKYLLIDEYQDFSQLFYEFISAILSRNPDLKLYCVGDPWQAINRFMGADTAYFADFEKYFPDSRRLSITKNYRSARNLVMLANSFMEWQKIPGSPAKAFKWGDGQVEVVDVRDVFIAASPEYLTYEQDQVIRQILYEDPLPDPLVPRYLKKIIELVLKEFSSGSDSILILSRTNQFRNKYKLDEMERKLKIYLAKNTVLTSDHLNNLRISTIHSSKGDEADAVIILEANRGKIPMVHPDNDLYKIFGETEETALQDEARLFYVAITRAKKNLYILHDDNPSEYLLRGSKLNGQSSNIP